MHNHGTRHVFPANIFIHHHLAASLQLVARQTALHGEQIEQNTSKNDQEHQ
jgi:hypothetical protein